ncbi:hypothetical protein BDC45DRAFT_529736 [Circinella umbellata]|nr:hypothetical protein BDC45DRAFT_529736 [Circinella umbellata]
MRISEYMIDKANGKLYLVGGRTTGGQAIQFSSIRRLRYGLIGKGKLYLVGDIINSTRKKKPLPKELYQTLLIFYVCARLYVRTYYLLGKYLLRETYFKEAKFTITVVIFKYKGK